MDPRAHDVERLRHALLRVARLIRQGHPQDLTASQVAVLASIDHDGPLLIGRIAAIERVSASAASRMVSALEDHGWVTRREGEDRRQTYIELSDAGRAVLDDVRSARHAWLAIRLRQLEPDVAAALMAAVPALEQLLAVDDGSQA